MVSENLPNIIKYIVSEVEDANYVIMRTRLVKLLYLCDYYYYQSKNETLTGLEWVRYKYGPYAFELTEITHRMRLDLGEEELDFSTGNGIKYEVYSMPDPEKEFDTRQRHVINRVINRWGGEDLNELLDFVYCDTEPMIGTKFGESLDFHSIRKGLRFSESDRLDLSQEAIREIKSLDIKQTPISTPATRTDFKIPCKTDNDEPDTPSISGKVKVNDIYSLTFFEGRE